jgi:hypothetical protein
MFNVEVSSLLFGVNFGLSQEGTERYLLVVAYKLPISSPIDHLCSPIILESGTGDSSRAARSIEIGKEVMGIELQNARVNVERCAEDIETNVRNDTSCFEDDRALRKLVRLVGCCHRGERPEVDSSGRDVHQTLLCEVDRFSLVQCRVVLDVVGGKIEWEI